MTSEYYKVDDDREPFTDTIPRDLSAGVSEVRFKMEHIVSEETVVNAAASVASSNSDSSTVEYAWSDGDLNRAGLHEAEWRVVYDDGDVETFPKDDQDNPQIDVSPVIDSGPVADPSLARVGPHDVYEFNELGSDPDPPAADDWGLFFKQDGNLYKIDENGTVSQVGGGGSASIAIEDDGTEILGAVSTIDFAGSDFGVSNPTGDEVQVVLTSDSLTVTAGNALTGGGSVALGGSTTLAVDESAIALANLAGDTDDLTEGASNLFHTDERAQDAVGTILSAQFTYDDAGPAINLDPHATTADAHHSRYTDAEAETAINNDADHGSTASHNYYTDSDAVAAINADADHGSTASHNYRTDEEIEDVVNALLDPGTNVSITYDDGTDTLTISATDTDTQLSNEEVEDIVGALITAGNAATVTYDDAGDSLSVGVDESAIDLSNLTGTLSAGQLADGAVSEAKLNAADSPSSGEVLKWNGSQLEWQPDDTGSGGSAIVLDLGDDGTNESSDLAEIATTNDANNIVTEPAADKALIDMGQNWPQADDVPDEVIEDVVGALVTGGAKISTTYDDAGNSLTIDTSALDTEEVEDAVAALVTTDSNLTLNYDDANDTLTIGLADSINVQSVSVENSVTMYVRSAGSDSNDGLSSGSAKATITAAIQDAPIQGPRNTELVIDVQEAATFTENVVLADYSIPEVVRIKGIGNINDTDTTTIDGGGADKTVFVERSQLILDSLHLTNPSDYNLLVTDFSHVRCSNVSADSPPTQNGRVINWSHFVDDADCVWSQTSAVSGSSNFDVFDSVFRASGTYDGGGDDAVIVGKEGAVILLDGNAILRGNGPSNTGAGIDLRDTSTVKTADTTFEDVFYSFIVSENSIARNNADIVENNVNRRWSVGRGGQARDESGNADMITSLGNANGALTDLHGGVTGGARDGWTWFDFTDTLPMAHLSSVGQGVPMVTNERAAPAAGDLYLRETCFDTTNNRLLFKDGSGTVHFWNTDGTL